MRFASTRELRKGCPRPRVTEAVVSIQEDANEPVFDLHRDLPRSVVKEYALEWYDRNEFGHIAGWAVMLYPDLRDELQLDAEKKRKIKFIFLRFINDKERPAAESMAAMLDRILFPEDRDDNSNVTKGRIQFLRQQLDTLREEEKWGEWITIASYLPAIDPNFRKEVDKDEELWKKVKEYYDSLDPTKEGADRIAWVAAIAMLFPDRKKELQITQKEWENKVQYMSEHKEDHYVYLHHAMWAHIASVERYEVTPEGEIIVTPRKTALDQSSELPPRLRV